MPVGHCAHSVSFDVAVSPHPATLTSVGQGMEVLVNDRPPLREVTSHVE